MVKTGKTREAVLTDMLEQVQTISEMLREYGPLGELERLKARMDEKIELLSIEGLPMGTYFIERSEAVPVEGKPYPNEHACRLNDPGKYDRFARKNCFKKSGGKCIDFIFGIKANKSEVQAFRYDKKIWDAGAAKSHCQKAKGTFEAASGKESE